MLSFLVRSCCVVLVRQARNENGIGIEAVASFHKKNPETLKIWIQSNRIVDCVECVIQTGYANLTYCDLSLFWVVHGRLRFLFYIGHPVTQIFSAKSKRSQSKKGKKEEKTRNSIIRIARKPKQKPEFVIVRNVQWEILWKVRRCLYLLLCTSFVNSFLFYWPSKVHVIRAKRSKQREKKNITKIRKHVKRNENILTALEVNGNKIHLTFWLSPKNYSATHLGKFVVGGGISLQHLCHTLAAVALVAWVLWTIPLDPHRNQRMWMWRSRRWLHFEFWHWTLATAPTFDTMHFAINLLFFAVPIEISQFAFNIYIYSISINGMIVLALGRNKTRNK